jgi:hypothetical protein
VVPSSDPREAGDSDTDGADLMQCRGQNLDGSFGPDTCPFAGGLDLTPGTRSGTHPLRSPRLAEAGLSFFGSTARLRFRAAQLAQGFL